MTYVLGLAGCAPEAGTTLTAVGLDVRLRDGSLDSPVGDGPAQDVVAGVVEQVVKLFRGVAALGGRRGQQAEGVRGECVRALVVGGLVVDTVVV